MIWIEAGSSNLLFWGGIALMAIAAVLAVVWTVVFCITGRRLKRKMEREYGRPER